MADVGFYRWAAKAKTKSPGLVFAVFHKHPEGRLEWIGAAETEERARLLARMWSRYGNREVVVIENGDNGRTKHLCSFLHGHPTAAEKSIN